MTEKTKMHFSRCPAAHASRILLTGLFALFGARAALAALPIQHWQQDSGAEVYFVASPSLPMVDVEVDFDAGARRDPAGKAGLASATAGMAEKGILAADPKASESAAGALPAYAAALDENEVSNAWADLGAGFGGDAGSDRMSFSLRTLTEPKLLDKSVALASRELGDPSFPAAVWKRERDRAIAALHEADTRPATVAHKAYSKAVYSGHPYGWQPTEASLDAISVDDMRAFYRDHILPCRAKVSIVGAVTRAQADDIARKLLARLPQDKSACQALPAVADVPALKKAEQIRIPFDAAQAQVLIGQPGYKRDDPDYFPLVVGNYILGGGGFVSRLTHEVREKRGLSYSVYSYFSPGLHKGAFTVGLQTRPDQAAEAVKVAKDVVARFVEDGPTQAELQAAKDNLVGGFALRLDSNRKLLANVSNIAWNGLPLDYLDTWTRKVQAVTVDDIRAAFQRKLQPDRMVTVVLGAAPAAGQRAVR